MNIHVIPAEEPESVIADSRGSRTESGMKGR